jgi:hypothetical protein
MRSIILTILISGLINIALLAQSNSAPTQQMATISNLYSIRDTVSKDYTSVTLNIAWMDSLIVMVKTTNLNYDLESMRKFRKDPTYVPSQQDTLSYNALRKSASQNCHSYALEKYFAYHNIVDKSLFTNRTSLKENYHMKWILATAFNKKLEIKTKPKQNLDYQFTEGALLVFRDKWGSPLHTVFYDGVFHSKYGALEAKAETSLKPILKKYWDTVIIEEHHLDYLKISNYLAAKD